MTPDRAPMTRRMLLALGPALLSCGGVWAQSAPAELAQALPGAILRHANDLTLDH